MSTISTIVGIDPGVTGAMVLLSLDGREVLDFYDFEAVDGRIILAPLIATLKRWKPESIHAAVVESVHSMPKQGLSTTFKFGRAAGYAEAVPAALEIATDFITPAQWKQHHKITGKPKDASRALALRHWPNGSEAFALKTSTGKGQKAKAQARADAALLCTAWLRKNPPLGEWIHQPREVFATDEQFVATDRSKRNPRP